MSVPDNLEENSVAYHIEKQCIHLPLIKNHICNNSRSISIRASSCNNKKCTIAATAPATL